MGKNEILPFAQDDRKAFCKRLKSFSSLTLSPRWEERGLGERTFGERDIL
jgi:hypothetical protein